MANENLKKAKKAKNDEFYTQYADIQKEINSYLDYNPNVFKNKVILLPCDDPEYSNFTKFFAQNFARFGLKKLISTSYAPKSKNFKDICQLSLLEHNSPKFDKEKTNTKGKIFVLEKDITGDGKIDIEDLEWQYLNGDGDFRSEEVKKLRDEADIIITNPPFSLFREFLAWIFEANKKFVIIGHQNAITYKEVFALIKNNKIWLGRGFKGGAGHFISNYNDYAASNNHIEGMIRVSGVNWFTNIEHGKRHELLKLMSMEENIKFSKHKDIRGHNYQKYENYNAIDVPWSDSIPNDYNETMGVPITFLDKYNPEQFEIVELGIVGSCNFINNRKMEILDKYGNATGKYTYNAKGTLYKKYDETKDKKPPAFKDVETGVLYSSIYARILIKRKASNEN